MEEEKPQPLDHQHEPADQGAADVPIYYHVTIFDDDNDDEEEGEEEDIAAKEEADRAAAIAADEEMAHRLYMQELMAMEEWELRGIDRPSSSCARGTFESVQEAESGAVFLGNSRIPGPLEALADERIREIRATRAVNRGGAGANTASGFMRPGTLDFATTRARARQTVFSKDAAGSSSSTQHDPVSTKRRALLAEADSAIIFAGMEEGDNNSWYESMVVPDDDVEKPDQVEVQGLNESLHLCLPGSEPSCNPAAATAAAEGHEFSLQDFCQRWGLTPSDVNPDDPSPSTKVAPLADHEVPTFDCGICTNTLPVFDLFHGLPCTHRFCAPCMTTFVERRIRAGDLPIPCPDLACEDGGVLHPEKCKKAIDYAAFGDWGARLAETALPPGRRAYCPNRRCRLLVETEPGPVMAPCPACGHALVRKLAQD